MHAIDMYVPAWGDKWKMVCSASVEKTAKMSWSTFAIYYLRPANLSSFHPTPREEGWRQSEISLKEASSVLYYNKKLKKKT